MRIHVRNIRATDTEAIIRIDALQSGESKPEYWKRLLAPYNSENRGAESLIGLVGELDGNVVGYVLGHVRAWEFGSPPCGWLFSIGVFPEMESRGVGTALSAHLRDRFLSLNVSILRTMVRQDDIPLLSFFRSLGFHAGPFVEMEMAV